MKRDQLALIGVMPAPVTGADNFEYGIDYLQAEHSRDSLQACRKLDPLMPCTGELFVPVIGDQPWQYTFKMTAYHKKSLIPYKLRLEKPMSQRWFKAAIKAGVCYLPYVDGKSPRVKDVWSQGAPAFGIPKQYLGERPDGYEAAVALRAVPLDTPGCEKLKALVSG